MYIQTDHQTKGKQSHRWNILLNYLNSYIFKLNLKFRTYISLFICIASLNEITRHIFPRSWCGLILASLGRLVCPGPWFCTHLLHLFRATHASVLGVFLLLQEELPVSPHTVPAAALVNPLQGLQHEIESAHHIRGDSRVDATQVQKLLQVRIHWVALVGGSHIVLQDLGENSWLKNWRTSERDLTITFLFAWRVRSTH